MAPSTEDQQLKTALGHRPNHPDSGEFEVPRHGVHSASPQIEEKPRAVRRLLAECSAMLPAVLPARKTLLPACERNANAMRPHRPKCLFRIISGTEPEMLANPLEHRRLVPVLPQLFKDCTDDPLRTPCEPLAEAFGKAFGKAFPKAFRNGYPNGFDTCRGVSSKLRRPSIKETSRPPTREKFLGSQIKSSNDLLSFFAQPSSQPILIL